MVEVDGAYFGGHTKQENIKADRKDRRLSTPAKRQSVVVARERGGKILPMVVRRESEAVALFRSRIATGAIVHADEAGGWDGLHAHFEMRRINHSVAFGLDGACTNQAESFFSRLRRAELGQHHHISGKYLLAYAAEMAWRRTTGVRLTGHYIWQLWDRLWLIRWRGHGRDIGSESPQKH